MRFPAVLLIASFYLTACPGTGDPSLRRKVDAGRHDGYVATPAPSPLTEVDGGVAPVKQDSQVTQPVSQQDSTVPVDPQPPQNPTCTAADSPCGSGQAACCTGALCVNYTNVGILCGKICTSASECAENCCIATSGGSSVCAPSSFCPAPTDPTPTDPTPTDPTPTDPTPTGTDDSCQGNCGGQAPSGCYCDLMCSIYGDCCADKWTYCIY